VIPWSPLDGGMLGGVLQKMEKGRRAGEQVQKRIDSLKPQLEAWEGLCKETGHKPADLALAWLIANPVVTAPIIGPRTMDQLTGSLAALEINVSEDINRRLNTIWPGPGGEAPEAYSW
jgi:aryl-alcohol dehydrogenase-like predicted oxidoreductase